jgi:hypothetical protein
VTSTTHQSTIDLAEPGREVERAALIFARAECGTFPPQALANLRMATLAPQCSRHQAERAVIDEFFLRAEPSSTKMQPFFFERRASGWPRNSRPRTDNPAVPLSVSPLCMRSIARTLPEPGACAQIVPTAIYWTAPTIRAHPRTWQVTTHGAHAAYGARSFRQ